MALKVQSNFCLKKKEKEKNEIPLLEDYACYILYPKNSHLCKSFDHFARI